MSNSPLVNYTRISPNKTSPRNHKIDTITIHCYVGQVSVESMAGWLCNPSAQASSNYGIGVDGSVGMFVEEKDRSWCSSNSSNDNRAITIECASDKTHPYAINDKVYKTLIELCTDICRRNGIKELKWKADKSLIGQPDKQNMTVHRWFKNKDCPGEYIYSRLGKIAAEVNVKLGIQIQNGIQATEFVNLSEKAVIDKIGPAFTADQKKSGILASVSLAQFILESGYGKTDLAQNANNCFGMKCTLSGNTWPGSVWDGKSKYTKKTQEFENGKYITVTADFRKYPKVEDSISDHSAYLLGAKNGSKSRYAGLKGCTDHAKAIGIIKNGGYATDPNYVNKILNIIDKWGLRKYDFNGTVTPETTNNYPATPFSVKVLIDDLNYRSEPSMDGSVNGVTGKGIFTIVEVSGGWGRLKSGVGWIWLGNADYCEIQGSSFQPYAVKVGIDTLRIRKGPGTNYGFVGYTGKGTFTIVEEAVGEGAVAGWGRLLSGAGWISLDYATKI